MIDMTILKVNNQILAIEFNNETKKYKIKNKNTVFNNLKQYGIEIDKEPKNIFELIELIKG